MWSYKHLCHYCMSHLHAIAMTPFIAIKLAHFNAIGHRTIKAFMHQEYAQELHDFTFYAELLGAIGYTLTERDILALSQAQKEI